jgi:hypothetical protein
MFQLDMRLALLLLYRTIFLMLKITPSVLKQKQLFLFINLTEIEFSKQKLI